MRKLRGIKFRGQVRKKGEKVNLKGEPLPGKWIYGGIFQCSGDRSVMYSVEDGKVSVYNDTVGQYTGLKVNGNAELCEGDIVEVKGSVYYGWKKGRDHFRANAVVIYDEKEMRFRFLAYTKNHGKQYVDFDKSIRQSYKIIGNIHDNPELLEIAG